MKITFNILHLIFILLFFSCSRVTNFDVYDRPDQKLNAAIHTYGQMLSSAQNGWIGYLFPAGGGGVTFKFKFDKNQRVQTYATLNAASASNSKESAYSLRSPQLVSLYFDTYSYLHELADPAVTTYGGKLGEGAGADIEFAFVKVSPDTIWLKGNSKGSDLLLVRATKEQDSSYIKKTFDFVQGLSKIDRFAYYHKKFVFQGQDYEFLINTRKSTIGFNYVEKGEVKNFFTEYVPTETGIVLRKPFEHDAVSITHFDTIAIDVKAGVMSTKINGKDLIEIKQQQTPVHIDVDAPKRMYTLYNYEFTSPTGFNIDGVEDSLKLKSEPTLLGIYYKMRYYIDNYDVLRFNYRDTAGVVRDYMPTFKTSISTPHVLTFTGNYINGTSPGDKATLSKKILEAQKLLIDPEGYYVYQNGERFFDLVSKKDSKTWIRFY